MRQKKIKLDTKSLASSSKADHQDDSVQNEEEQETEKIKRLKILMKQILENPLILFKISYNLTPHQLIICRLVNKKWNSVVSQLLLKQDCCKVDLQRSIGYSPNSLALQDLINLLKNSVNFPIRTVNFTPKMGTSLKDILHFCEVYGSKITTLSLVFSSHQASLNKVRKIVSTLTPKLENLYIDVRLPRDQDAEEKEEEEELTEFNLPSLKSFSWSHEDVDVIETLSLEILKGARNLTTIPNFNLSTHCCILKQAGKINLIKKVECRMLDIDSDTEAKLIEFLEAKPTFTSLRFNFSRGKVKPFENVMLFQRLLISSSNSLECLELNRLCLDYPGIILPKFSKLKILKLNITSHLEKYLTKDSFCFPPSINLTLTFPHLETLDMSCLRLDEVANWKKYFHPLSDDPREHSLLTSVRHVMVNGTITENLMTKILEDLCPLFNRLTVTSCGRELQCLLKKIFKKWSHLENIEINVHKCSLFQLYNLDAALTGLTENFCHRFCPSTSGFSPDFQSELIGNLEDKASKEMLRRRPGLWSMTNLKKFEITKVRDRAYQTLSGQVQSDVDYVPIVSETSVKYALKMTPDLKFTIQVDPKYEPEGFISMLTSLSPNVQVVYGRVDSERVFPMNLFEDRP